MKSILSLAVVLGAIPATSIQAKVLYDQPLANWGYVFSLAYLSADSQYLGDDMRVFASFSLIDDSTLQLGTFAIQDSINHADDINVSIWDEPFGTELYSIDVSGNAYGRVPTDGDPTFYALVTLPNWQLPAGDYWVSMLGINDNEIAWGTDIDAENGNEWNMKIGDDIQYNLDGILSNEDIYVGFSLSGVQGFVPEPGRLALIAFGVAACVQYRHRRSNNAY